MKDKIQIIAAGVSLFALLTYTLVHTGGLLARYINPPAVGYVAALGIELSIVSLSLRIGDMRRARQSDRFFIAVLVAVVTVSAVANIAEGFHTLHGQPLTAATIRQLDPLQAGIGLLATGLISLIVLALSEIAGTDVSTAIRKAEREAKRAEQATAQASIEPVQQQKEAMPEPAQASVKAGAKAQPAQLAPQVYATPATVADLTEAQRRVYDAIKAQPDATHTQIGELLGISRQAVSGHVSRMNGVMK